MTNAHTPTPWIAGDDDDSDLCLVGPEAFPGVVTNPVARLHSEADAAFIVRACNAHDDLVGALSDLVAVYCAAGLWKPEEVPQVIAARAALSKAQA